VSVNEHRRRQLMDLMAERRWDSILLYGHGWRKDYFRCLVNVNYSGPHAAAWLSRSGELTVIVVDPWDRELIADTVLEKVICAPDFGESLPQVAAVAGLELMEERVLTAQEPISATADVEELRRVKTAEEIATLRRACDLADRGYQYFAEVMEVGMREYELVAEVEGFLKSNGAEDNFMLIASGGTEVVGMRPPTERKLQRGDSVTTELTPQVDGYYAQICRTAVLGEPSERQRQSFAIFSEVTENGNQRLNQTRHQGVRRGARAKRRVPQVWLRRVHGFEVYSCARALPGAFPGRDAAHFGRCGLHDQGKHGADRAS